MRDTNDTRRKDAEVAANWIKTGTGATLLEHKRHTQDPRDGWTPYFNWAIRNADGELADIDEGRFCELLGMVPQNIWGGTLATVLKHNGYTIYDHGAGGLTIIEKHNPLLTK